MEVLKLICPRSLRQSFFPRLQELHQRLNLHFARRLKISSYTKVYRQLECIRDLHNQNVQDNDRIESQSAFTSAVLIKLIYRSQELTTSLECRCCGLEFHNILEIQMRIRLLKFPLLLSKTCKFSVATNCINEYFLLTVTTSNIINVWTFVISGQQDLSPIPHQLTLFRSTAN